jgi:hypothetical protein
MPHTNYTDNNTCITNDPAPIGRRSSKDCPAALLLHKVCPGAGFCSSQSGLVHRSANDFPTNARARGFFLMGMALSLSYMPASIAVESANTSRSSDLRKDTKPPRTALAHGRNVPKLHVLACPYPLYLCCVNATCDTKEPHATPETTNNAILLHSKNVMVHNQSVLVFCLRIGDAHLIVAAMVIIASRGPCTTNFRIHEWQPFFAPVRLCIDCLQVFCT